MKEKSFAKANTQSIDFSQQEAETFESPYNHSGSFEGDYNFENTQRAAGKQGGSPPLNREVMQNL